MPAPVRTGDRKRRSATPVKFIEVLAYTVWDACCKEDCDCGRKEDDDDAPQELLRPASFLPARVPVL